MEQTTQQPTTTIRDVYQDVTDKIIRQLEKGTVPWQQPWKGEGGALPSLPMNFITGNHYRGINIVLLWCAALEKEYSSSEWASFNQWQSKKESIRKGEKGNMVVYYDTFEKEVDGEIKKIPFLKASVVFNRCQLNSYAPNEKPVPYDGVFEFTGRIEKVENFIANTGAEIQHQGSRAKYAIKDDVIYMPNPESFISTPSSTATEAYYSTILHELTHWSGAEKRLNRKWGKRFGDENYATEELVAELGAAFLCADMGLNTIEKEDHAAYIAYWLKVLKDNKKCIVHAASDASKAVDFLNTFQPS